MTAMKLLALALCSTSAIACTITAAPAPGPAGITAQQACSDYAKSLCNKLDACRVNGTAITYGTAGTCMAVQTDRCVAAQASPGDGNSPDATESCATMLPNATCEQYLENAMPMCPQHDGSLALGGACTFNSQCQSGFCALTTGDACGVCAPEPVIGDECADRGCGSGQVCTPNKTCGAYVATGGTCDNKTQVCTPLDSCVIASGAATGTCQPLGTTAGVACDPKKETAPTCALNSGLFCNAQHVCDAITYVTANAACGSQSSGAAYDYCSSGSSCFSGTCLLDGQLGDACDTSSGPSCAGGLRCVWDGSGPTSGTCAALDPTVCM